MIKAINLWLQRSSVTCGGGAGTGDREIEREDFFFLKTLWTETSLPGTAAASSLPPPRSPQPQSPRVASAPLSWDSDSLERAW